MSQIALIPNLNDGEGARSNATANRLDASDRVIHDWYRFVLSFPPYLVLYKHDDDDRWIAHNAEIQALATEIEQRRIELGKTSGFEKMYARVTRYYFGGMARHLAELRPFLKPGAYLGYAVGDQASFFQVLIQTGRLLADIAAELGYEVVGIDLFRTRLATATKRQMREEVVVLRWPEPPFSSSINIRCNSQEISRIRMIC